MRSDPGPNSDWTYCTNEIESRGAAFLSLDDKFHLAYDRSGPGPSEMWPRAKLRMGIVQKWDRAQGLGKVQLMAQVRTSQGPGLRWDWPPDSIESGCNFPASFKIESGCNFQEIISNYTAISIKQSINRSTCHFQSNNQSIHQPVNEIKTNPIPKMEKKSKSVKLNIFLTILNPYPCASVCEWVCVCV